MNNFTSDLIVRSYTSSKWELNENFFFYFDESNKNIGIIVPKGFVTDFASIPRIFWSIIPPTGRYTKAAVLHDFLYSIDSNYGLRRKQCDLIFLKAMKILKVKKWKRIIMYLGVRLFGGGNF